ncbi:C-type lectin domain family 10 member A-like [Protopterus annectens]|uniref:C-type lectin domain family 10 member A-like n=1 Tax=Protopterus annectens TaxID=7888 RepID=UPI001CFC0E27|nr:C-type lectin domain family 10 member A-like [Protopterus annectens]
MSKEISQCIHDKHPTDRPKTTAMTTSTERTMITSAHYIDCILNEEIMFQNSCYFFSHDKHNTWFESQKYCKQRNSDLAVIKSSTEQQFLKLRTALDGGFYWIGLQNAGAETWKWVDGTVCDVHNKSTAFFVNGKPSSRETDEDCAFMTYPDGLWDTEKCGFSYRWVCERKINK